MDLSPEKEAVLKIFSSCLLPMLVAFSNEGTLSPNKGTAQGTLSVAILSGKAHITEYEWPILIGLFPLMGLG